MLAKKSTYFPGLHAFRFIAAALVVLCHLQGLKKGLHLSSTGDSLVELGTLAVYSFFVLSGYLITYLLLVERARFGTIDLKGFYMRRILRIWPLYFLLLLVGLLLLSRLLPVASTLTRETYSQTLGLYFAFLPNVAATLGHRLPYVDHLWSIGVEEQFYLIWPVLLIWARGRQLGWVLVGIVVVFGLGRVGMYELQARVEMAASTKQQLLFGRSLLLHTPLSCMAIGGLGAYALYHWPELTRRALGHRVGELVALAIIYGLYTHPFFLAYGFKMEVYAVLFGYLILSISTAPRSFLRLEGAHWTYLGDISYGIYAMHWVALVLVGWALTHLGIRISGLAAETALYGTSLLLAMGLAAVSHRYYESYFIRLKARFQVGRQRAVRETPRHTSREVVLNSANWRVPAFAAGTHMMHLTGRGALVL